MDGISVSQSKDKLSIDLRLKNEKIQTGKEQHTHRTHGRAKTGPKIETHKLEFKFRQSNLLSIASRRSLFIIYRLAVGLVFVPIACMAVHQTAVPRTDGQWPPDTSGQYRMNETQTWARRCILQFHRKFLINFEIFICPEKW